VVDDAAAPVTTVAFDELPGRESRVPTGFEAADHVAVAVAEHGGQPLAFAAVGEKERAARLAVPEHATAKAERLQRRLHLGFDVAGKLAGALGVLTLGRDRDAPREIVLERAAVEIVLRARDGVGTAHVNSRNVCGASLLAPVPQWQAPDLTIFIGCA